jgi:bifunctional ADP-heptose synthase (sugar kinase/adenylyltransferase)
MPTSVEIVRRFRRLRALVVGDVMLDTYIEGAATRLCGEGPAPVVRKDTERRAAGGAANTAANLRALGASVMLVGVVGCDMGATRCWSAACARCWHKTLRLMRTRSSWPTTARAKLHGVSSGEMRVMQVKAACKCAISPLWERTARRRPATWPGERRMR